MASDLENQLPRIIPDVRTFQITTSAGDRLQARARSRVGLRARFDVVLRPGWCPMQSRFLIFGMAAVPDDGGTRFAGLAALRIPGARLLPPLTGCCSPSGSATAPSAASPTGPARSDQPGGGGRSQTSARSGLSSRSQLKTSCRGPRRARLASPSMRAVAPSTCQDLPKYQSRRSWFGPADAGEQSNSWP